MEGKGSHVQRSPNLFHENEIFLTFFSCPPLSGGLVTRVEGVLRPGRLIHGPAGEPGNQDGLGGKKRW